QNILAEIFSSDPAIEVVGIAGDPLEARDMIKEKKPDVITLDIIMPHMDGITFLKNLLRLHPMPVVMVSSLTQKNSEIALEALAIGAVDYLGKPNKRQLTELSEFSEQLITAVKKASEIQVKPYIAHPVPRVEARIGFRGLESASEKSMLKNVVIA